MSALQNGTEQAPEAGADWVLEGEQAAAPDVVDPAALDAQSAEQPAPNDPPALTDLERFALEQGWTPQDRWRGPPQNWRPAEDFLRANREVLDRTKNDLRMTRQAMEATNARLAALEQGQQTLAQRDLESIHNQYEDAKFLAAKDGNAELYRKLADEQREIMARSAPPQQPMETPNVYAQADAIMADPVASRFYTANPIAFQDDSAWALAEAERAAVAQRGGTPAQQFRAAEEALRWAYPDAYQQQPMHRAQTQPRAGNGQFVAQQQQQRRPAPPLNGATRVNGAPAAQTTIDKLDGATRQYLDAQVKAGAVKDPETWARRFLGEKGVPVVKVNGAAR